MGSAPAPPHSLTSIRTPIARQTIGSQRAHRETEKESFKARRRGISRRDAAKRTLGLCETPHRRGGTLAGTRPLREADRAERLFNNGKQRKEYAQRSETTKTTAAAP